MVRDSSWYAYDKLFKQGKRIPQWMKVILAVRMSKNGLTRAEIQSNTGLRLSSVCGRVNELIKERVLCDHETRKCRETGEKVHVVKMI